MIPQSPPIEPVPSAEPCVCAQAGWCERYRRHMLGVAWTVCQGGAEVANIRDDYLSRQAHNAVALRAQQAHPNRDKPCVHLGPVTGRTRDCPTCSGNVREKLYECGTHGECTLKDCRTCRDYHPVVEQLGGLHPADHTLDHFALCFGKGRRFSLLTGDGRADHTCADLYPHSTWFFLGGGPSLADVDLAALEGRNTIAANGVCEVFPRPTVWTCVDPPDDPPGRFKGVPWADPDVLKLIPRALAGCDTGDGLQAHERPSTGFFPRNGLFRPWTFLEEPSVNWGGDRPFGAARSVMLCALRLVYYLGGRRLVLLGCDFKMDPERPYAHSAAKDERGCASNNDKFRILDRRFGMLRPYLERARMTVVNATPGSHLTAFPLVDLAEELAR